MDRALPAKRCGACHERHMAEWWASKRPGYTADQRERERRIRAEAGAAREAG